MHFDSDKLDPLCSKRRIRGIELSRVTSNADGFWAAVEVRFDDYVSGTWAQTFAESVQLLGEAMLGEHGVDVGRGSHGTRLLLWRIPVAELEPFVSDVIYPAAERSRQLLAPMEARYLELHDQAQAALRAGVNAATRQP